MFYRQGRGHNVAVDMSVHTFKKKSSYKFNKVNKKQHHGFVKDQAAPYAGHESSFAAADGGTQVAPGFVPVPIMVLMFWPALPHAPPKGPTMIAPPTELMNWPGICAMISPLGVEVQHAIDLQVRYRIADDDDRGNRIGARVGPSRIDGWVSGCKPRGGG